MAGEQDDSGRFDYLFQPLDDDMANTEGSAAPVEQADADERRSRTAARIGIAAVVVAMIAVAVATVLFLLQRPNPASRLDAPTSPSAPPSVEPIATIEPVYQAPPHVTASSIEPPPPTAIVVPQPQVPSQPQPIPTTSIDGTEQMPPSPTMRAPISVEPEPHPPFPNQNAPSGDDDQGGGVLGGLF